MINICLQSEQGIIKFQEHVILACVFNSNREIFCVSDSYTE